MVSLINIFFYRYIKYFFLKNITFIMHRIKKFYSKRYFKLNYNILFFYENLD